MITEREAGVQSKNKYKNRKSKDKMDTHLTMDNNMKTNNIDDGISL